MGVVMCLFWFWNLGESSGRWSYLEYFKVPQNNMKLTAIFPVKALLTEQGYSGAAESKLT